MITIIGLGVEAGDVSQRAKQAILSAEHVVVRSELMPSVETLKEWGVKFTSFDSLYEKSRSFDTLTKNIVKELVKLEKVGTVAYCVDGGVTEDSAAKILLARKNVGAIDGVSKAQFFATKANLGTSYQAVSAYEVTEKKLALPLVVYDVDSRETAGDVKLRLAELFGDEARAYLYCLGEGKEIELYEADREEEYDSLSAIVVYEQELLKKKRFDMDDLMAILHLLRAEDGCPWDKVQTHESIRIDMIEEAYELVDGIDRGDVDRMLEECGDVIMQSAFHTTIEEENGNFGMSDVLSGLCNKLIGRHSHVFGDDVAKSADGALTLWDTNKMKEKGQKTYSEAVNDVPEGFPALLRAQKIVRRMSKGGWGYKEFDDVKNKLFVEMEELKEAYQSGDEKAISGELGDCLMVMAQVGKTVGVECEQALLDTVKEVQGRFTRFEALVLEDGKNMNELTEEEWEDYYRKAKNENA